MDTLTVSQVANLLGTSAATVRRWAGQFAEHLSGLASPAQGQERYFTHDDIRALCYARDRLKRGVGVAVVKDEMSTATLPPWSSIVRDSVVSASEGLTAGSESQENALVAVLSSQHAALSRLADGLGTLADVGALTARLDALQRQVDDLQRQVDALSRNAHKHTGIVKGTPID